jgi:hypothetical protein
MWVDRYRWLCCSVWRRPRSICDDVQLFCLLLNMIFEASAERLPQQYHCRCGRCICWRKYEGWARTNGAVEFWLLQIEGETLFLSSLVLWFLHIGIASDIISNHLNNRIILDQIKHLIFANCNRLSKTRWSNCFSFTIHEGTFWFANQCRNKPDIILSVHTIRKHNNQPSSMEQTTGVENNIISSNFL